jgi:hypothetical protein
MTRGEGLYGYGERLPRMVIESQNWRLAMVK